MGYITHFKWSYYDGYKYCSLKRKGHRERRPFFYILPECGSFAYQCINKAIIYLRIDSQNIVRKNLNMYMMIMRCDMVYTAINNNNRIQFSHYNKMLNTLKSENGIFSYRFSAHRSTLRKMLLFYTQFFLRIISK